MIEDISVIIKTMIRPDSLCRLLRSFQTYYPKMQIYIADDGVWSSKAIVEAKYPTMNIRYYDLPQDSGLSYGRNYLLERITTKYFLLCDDDFVIDQTLDLAKLKRLLEAKQLDILGGYFRNYKIVKGRKDRLIVAAQKLLHYELCTNYIGTLTMEDHILTCRYQRKAFPQYCESDITMNFFLADTAAVRRIGGWDEKLKLQEHTEFFLRAKLQGLKVGFTDQMSVKHFPEFTKGYEQQRLRDFGAYFLKKYDLRKAYYLFDESSRNHMEYLDDNGELVIQDLGGKEHE